MKYFKIFEMMRCYCESKSDRCENCRLTQAVKAMPNGIDENAAALVMNGNYDMLILEDVPSDGVEPKWIHVSWKRNGENRKVIMKKVCGKDSCEELSKLDRMQLEAD